MGFREPFVHPRATCHVRTPTGAAAHDRGDGQTLRFGQRPRWSGRAPSGKPSKHTPYPQKGRIREPPLPDLAGMMAHRAGNSRHNRPSCRLEVPVRSLYLEFVCVQVRMRLGRPRHPARRAPDRGHCADVVVPPYPRYSREPEYSPQSPADSWQVRTRRRIGPMRRMSRPRARPSQRPLG